MTGVIAVEPDAFRTAAADLYEQTFVATTNAFYTLDGVLAGCTSMAGGDPAGAWWALSYESATTGLTRGWQQLATAVYRAVCLLDQCGRNHAAADEASRPGGAADVPVGRFDPSFSTHLTSLPPAGGTASSTGGSDAPTGWGLIQYAVGYVWPGGHQGQLHTAADAWDAAALSLEDAADGTAVADVDLAMQDSPETDDALHTIWALAAHLRYLAHACRVLARSCRGLAAHIDSMRSQVEHELISLGAQTAAIEGVGALVSVCTLGAAEAPTQAVEATRISAAVTAVQGIIETFGALVREVAESLPQVGRIADGVITAVRGLAGTRIRIVEVVGAPGLRAIEITRGERITSTAMTAEGRAEAGLARLTADSDLPAVTISQAQAESKFKHAAALGIDEARGKAGFAAFQRRITEFVTAAGTTRQWGIYRGEKAVLNYDRSTGQLVIQRTDGSFWSAWRLTARQLRNLEESGELGLR